MANTRIRFQMRYVGLSSTLSIPFFDSLVNAAAAIETREIGIAEKHIASPSHCICTNRICSATNAIKIRIGTIENFNWKTSAITEATEKLKFMRLVFRYDGRHDHPA